MSCYCPPKPSTQATELYMVAPNIFSIISEMCFRSHSLGLKHKTVLPLQFLNPAHVTSSSNNSYHLSFEPPLLLSSFPSGLVKKDFLCRITFFHPHHMSRLINFTTSCSSYSLYFSEFLCLLQHPFSGTGTNIFHRNVLSKELRRFTPWSPKAQVMLI